MHKLPEYIPDYTIERLDAEPFHTRWEEMQGWMIVPRLGEKLTWGLYDFPSRKRNEHCEMEVVGKAEVHGIEGVEIVAVQYETQDYYRTGALDRSERHFVAQLTDKELGDLTRGEGGMDSPLGIRGNAGAFGGITEDLRSRGIPALITADGPSGLRVKRSTSLLPCGTAIACSWNESLTQALFQKIGEESVHFGVDVILSPGMNIHRNPLCGRTFEYYSEDPYVSGKMAAAIVRGVQRHPGKGMSIKHFAANNCELVRNFSSSNVSERALREIYLRGFEIAVKESSPMTVMAAYNKINGVYCTNNYDLLVKVLRNEWGFEGLVMSDWDSMKADPENPVIPRSGDVQKAHAAQCDLVSPGRPDQREALKKGLETGAVRREDLKRSAVRILKMIRSNTVLESK